MATVNSATVMNALSRMAARPSRLAVGWFVATSLVVGCAGLCSLLLATALGKPSPAVLPLAFLVSTLMLAGVSAGLFEAERSARHEKQPRLRTMLAASLAAAVLFLAVQSVALTALVAGLSPTEAPLGPTAWLFVAVALHALHVAAGVGWLTYATLRGLAGHYDHEYRLGLAACGWCWHALGVVWLVILASFLATVS